MLWGEKESVTQAFQESITKSQEISFDKGGQIWQWMFNVTDTCGSSSINTNSLVRTPSVAEQPCCPPGLALDLEQQHGCCHGHESTCICRQACATMACMANIAKPYVWLVLVFGLAIQCTEQFVKSTNEQRPTDILG